MTGRIGKIILISLLIIIVILSVLMFFVNSEEDISAKTYNISVLVNSPGDRFTKGVSQAALDYNVDIHMISGYDDSPQQMQYLQRELLNGADAIVLNPYDPENAEEYLVSLRPRTAVVTVGQRLENGELAAHVGVDNMSLGQKLGDLIWQEAPGKECLIFLSSSENEKPYISKRREGLEAILEEKGVSFNVITLKSDAEDIDEYLQNVDGVVIAVLDEETLLFFCERARDNDMIFGIGYTAQVRSYLESGRIEYLVVYSEYDAGYLSIREAVGRVENKGGETILLDSSVVNSDMMYLPPLVQILFPVGQ